VGAYLAINGAFEHFALHTLVWPKYILDPNVGIQFGRTRGSFASSEGLGMALIVSFLFYAFYATCIKRKKLYWPYPMMLVTAGVIYTTNQRSVWLSFGLCLALLAIARTEMKQVSRVFIGLVLLGFFLGVGTHFSFWASGTLFSKRQETVSYRQANDLTTMAMGMANPIFGVGFDNFKSEWPKYFRPIDGSEIEIRDLTDGNHNTFLGLFAEIGLVGLVPYLLIFYHMFRIGLRVYRREEGLAREFSLLFLLVAISYVIGGNFSDYRSGRFHNTVLFLLFGAVARIDVQGAIRRSPLAARSPESLTVSSMR
jgi:O-antigen ligase